MKHKKKLLTFNAWGLIIGFALAVMFVRHDATAAQATISLGSAAKFAVLSATTVTSTGATTVNGHISKNF